MHTAKSAHEHTGSAEAVRPSLRNGFTAYIVLSPARPGLLVTVAPKKRELLANLTPAIGASGPHDFAIRFNYPRQSQPLRPPHPTARFVTCATPLSSGGMAIEMKLICLRDQARPLRHIGTTGNSAKCCQGLIRGSMRLSGASACRVGKASSPAVAQRAKAQACPPITRDASMERWARRKGAFAHPTNYPTLSVMPPSTTSSSPVTYFDSSEARNNAALATSQASPIWPIGTCASRARHIASTSPAA
jgi:hypothetical protein